MGVGLSDFTIKSTKYAGMWYSLSIERSAGLVRNRVESYYYGGKNKFAYQQYVCFRQLNFEIGKQKNLKFQESHCLAMENFE